MLTQSKGGSVFNEITKFSSGEIAGLRNSSVNDSLLFDHNKNNNMEGLEFDRMKGSTLSRQQSLTSGSLSSH